MSPWGHSIFQRPSGPQFARRGVLLLGAWCLCATAAPLGMVSDDLDDRLSIFDATLDTVTASLDAGPGMALGDCVIDRRERLGVTSGSSAEITFVDLEPLGSGVPRQSGRLGISNLGVDMALSPDDRYLVLAGGGALQQPLSVVDTELRAEVSTARWFVDHTSVEFCDNGTLLVTTINGAYFGGRPDNALYDVRVSASGQLSLLGHRVSSGAQPNNATCAPGSLSGVLLDRSGGVTSFMLPELEPVTTVDTGRKAALAAAFSADGRRLFVRTADSIQNFDFNPVTADLSLRWRQPAPEIPAFFGMERIALHPEGRKLYVDGGDAMLILDADSGELTGAIEIGDTTGICLAAPRREMSPDRLAQREAP